LKVRIGARTDKGRKRLLNEDSLYCNIEMGLFVVADGMGGHRAGEVASKIAVETIAENLRATMSSENNSALGEYHKEFSRETNKLADSIRLANCKIYKTAQKSPEYYGMGATIASVLLSSNIMSVAYVGDSRIYLIRDKSINQLTTDHSLVSEQLKMGLISEGEAKESRLRNVITRALGMEMSVEIELDEQVILNNDYILMCSDGLYDMVEDGEILSTVLRFSKKPQEACDRLVELSNDHGGRDNISVILLHFSG